MDYMRDMKNNEFDLAIADPEQGRKQHGGVVRGGHVKQKNGSSSFVPGGEYKKKSWDYFPADSAYFKELHHKTKEQIIWGCNYYYEIFGPGRIVWDKVNDRSHQSDCEIAYNSLTDRIDMIRYMWNGMMQGKSIEEGTVQQGNKKLNEVRIHPTQKPVLLYKWILNKYARSGWRILDTHGGSFSLAIACYDLGFDLTIIEKEKDYFEAGKARLEEHKKQQSLFI